MPPPLPLPPAACLLPPPGTQAGRRPFAAAPPDQAQRPEDAPTVHGRALPLRSSLPNTRALAPCLLRMHTTHITPTHPHTRQVLWLHDALAIWRSVYFAGHVLILLPHVVAAVLPPRSRRERLAPERAGGATGSTDGEGKAAAAAVAVAGGVGGGGGGVGAEANGGVVAAAGSDRAGKAE